MRLITKYFRMKNGLILLGTCLALGLMQSCYYDVEEELYPSIECNTAAVTFSTEISKILQNNCFSCHDAANNFGGVTLEGYELLKVYVDNGSLLGAVKQEDGYSAMPKNQPPLVECDIEKLEAWINAGAPNN